MNERRPASGIPYRLPTDATPAPSTTATEWFDILGSPDPLSDPCLFVDSLWCYSKQYLAGYSIPLFAVITIATGLCDSYLIPAGQLMTTTATKSLFDCLVIGTAYHSGNRENAHNVTRGLNPVCLIGIRAENAYRVRGRPDQSRCPGRGRSQSRKSLFPVSR